MSLRKKDTFLIKGVLRIIQMNKGRLKLTELIHVCIKVIIIILIGVVMIGMLQLIFGIINESIRMGTRDSLALMVNDIATFFIFLEIILMLFRQSGALGNTIFFVCSAWFLIDKDRYARKKLFYLE